VIDIERFWAEPGIPGMSRDEAEAQLRQMGAWLESLPGASGKFDISQVPGMTARPGVTEEQINDWERAHRVRLPDVLHQALARQNGGFVRETRFQILSLEEFQNPDAEFWEWASYKEDEVPDRGAVYRFAEDEFGGSYFLNYGTDRANLDPGVLVHHHDPGDLRVRAKSVVKFFDRMLATSDGPSVDWSEIATLQVIARESIDLSPIHGGRPANKEQVLGRKDGALILLAHEQAPSGESYSRTALPEPLDAQAARLQPHRPDPAATFGLTLQPDNTDGILAVESERTSDGRWKNSTSHGVPVCVMFESADRSQLEALRRELFGKAAAERAHALEESQAKLQSQLESASPQERQAAILQMMLQMRAQQEQKP
jgi:hypothetical protein